MGSDDVDLLERGKRSAGLDVTRTLAIGSVLICHVILLYRALFPVSAPLAIASTLLGYYGVELFFALSGFLIGGILLREVVPDPCIRSVGRFFVRRWLRILPAYYAVLFLLMVGEWMHGAPVVPRWDYLLFVQNYTHGAEGFFPVSWSLTIEQWSYIAAPVVLLFLPRLFVRLTSNPQGRIWLSLFAVFCVFLLFRLMTGLWTDATWDVGIRKQIHLRLDAVFFGVLVVSLKHYLPAYYNRLASLPCFLLLWGGLFLLIRFQAGDMFVHNAPGGPDGSLFYKSVGFSLTNLLLALTLPFFASCRHFAAMAYRTPRLFRFFSAGSRYAYALYLVHYTVFVFMSDRLAGLHAASLPVRIFAFGGGTAAALLLSLVAAVVVHLCIEKPGMDSRRYVDFQIKKQNIVDR